MSAEEESRERQRVWSQWLDERFGPGAEPLHLEFGDDREELAARLAIAVRETPRLRPELWGSECPK